MKKQKQKQEPTAKFGFCLKLIVGLVMLYSITFMHPLDFSMNVSVERKNDNDNDNNDSKSSPSNDHDAKDFEPSHQHHTITDVTQGLKFLQTSGEHWKIWDASSTEPLYNDQGLSCSWGTYTRNEYQKSAEMCLHDDGDIVSKRVFLTHQWDCCKAVQYQLHDGMYNSTGKPINVHLEIGANIGSCVVEALLVSPSVHVIAFEPFPRNLFRLTSTLLRNPDFHRRVTVFPIGLGNQSETIQMAVQQGRNYGSAHIEPHGKTDFGEQDEIIRKAVNVSVERLDDVLAVQDGSFRIPLMKADVQGFECRVLDGMPNLLDQVSQVLTELDDSMLGYQGCSNAGLLERLAKHHRKPQWFRGTGLLDPIRPSSNGINIVAKHKL